MSSGPNPEVDLILETDGATKKTNPGPSGWGFVALGPWENVIYEDCGLIPGAVTSNEAEYYAALKALEFAKDLGYPRSVEVRADSLTMIRQLQGRYGFRSTDLNEIADRVRSLMDVFDRVDLLWVPRRWNEHANALASAAFQGDKVQAAVRKIKRETFKKMPSGHRTFEMEGIDDV